MEVQQHVFEKDNEIGKRGEKLFGAYLDALGIKYLDVSNNDKYRSVDVDFIVYGENSKILVEVKNDTRMHGSGNIYYESISNKTYQTLGCFEKTKADLMVICSEYLGNFYVMYAQRLKDYVHANKDKLPKKETKGSNSEGYLIRIFSDPKNGLYEFTNAAKLIGIKTVSFKKLLKDMENGRPNA